MKRHIYHQCVWYKKIRRATEKQSAEDRRERKLKETLLVETSYLKQISDLLNFATKQKRTWADNLLKWMTTESQRLAAKKI